MVRSRTSGHSRPHSLWDRLAAERKKTAFGIALLAVMAFLWVRVFTGHRPSSVAAQTSPTGESPAAQKPPQNICYLKLPHVPGRNDYINRDFFAARDWECFRQNSAAPQASPDAGASTAFANRDRDVAVRLAQKLELEAIFREGTPQAFINDQWVPVGKRLTVRDGPDLCEFEVLDIYEDSVIVGCNGIRLPLKLTEHLDVSN